MIRRILKALGLLKIEYHKVESYTLLKPFDKQEQSYWVALSHISNSEEFRFCLHCMERDVIEQIEHGTGPNDAPASLEHKAGVLFGIRQVDKMLRLSQLRVREFQLLKKIEEDDDNA